MNEQNKNEETLNTSENNLGVNDKNLSEKDDFSSDNVNEEHPEQLLLEHFSKDDLLDKIKDLESQLEEKNALLKESGDWKNKFMRLQAEFENAQKRWTRDRQNIRIQNIASILKSFLPLYDSYKKAIENDPDNESIKQFYNQFLNILRSQEGMEIMKINPTEPFDYTYHEALSSIERDDLPNNSIIDVVQDGWMLGKEVLRYAKVITSRKPKPSEAKIENDLNSENIDENIKESENNSDIEL